MKGKSRVPMLMMKISLGLFILFLFSYYQNNMIQVTDITVHSEKIPQSFEGFKILQISDLHSKYFGKEQNIIFEKIEKIAPDIIVVTGDSVDYKKYDTQAALTLFKKLQTIAPIYFVTGNHENRTGRFVTYEKQLNEIGINVLRNKRVTVEREGEQITVMGVDDPTLQTGGSLDVALSELGDTENFTVLLSHRPEKIMAYAENGMDLVFSGHAHGGQIRIPFVGGIIAPNQGFFPEYFSGLYALDDTQMIVSRGLGNSLFPQRLFNQPELIVATLSSK